MAFQLQTLERKEDGKIERKLQSLGRKREKNNCQIVKSTRASISARMDVAQMEGKNVIIQMQYVNLKVEHMHFVKAWLHVRMLAWCARNGCGICKKCLTQSSEFGKWWYSAIISSVMDGSLFSSHPKSVTSRVSRFCARLFHGGVFESEKEREENPF